MSSGWWSSLKEKLPESVRQLPTTTSTYFTTAPTKEDTVASLHRTIELSPGVSLKDDIGEASAKGGYDHDEGEDNTSTEERLKKALESPSKSELPPSIDLDSDDLVIEGWLAKQTILTTVNNNTHWQNRYFILKRGCLFYYSIIPENTVKLEHFLIEQMDDGHLPVHLEGTEKIGYRITLRFSYSLYPKYPPAEEMNHILMLACSTEDDRNAWLDAFRRIESGSTTERRKGWLMSRDLKIKSWGARFFTLNGKVLEYHHRERKGGFPLSGCTVTSLDGFSFSIKDPTGKILNLTADSQESRDRWMNAIKGVVELLENREHRETKKTLLEISSEMLEYRNALRDLVQPQLQLVEEKIRQNIEKGVTRPTAGPDGKFRIISMDGGGMRGVMNCIILDRLIQVFPDLLSRVNMWVGTSNGGMLAMAFAIGMTPNLCRTVLELGGSTVFRKQRSYPPPHKAKFSALPLKILCDEIYGKVTLGQVSSYVLLPALLLDNQATDKSKRECEIRFYHNLPRKGMEEYCPMMNELCTDVVMRTIAAPTYFPSFQQHVDGGMFAHSPASTALTLVIGPNGLQKKVEDVIMISLGTGKVNHYYEDDEHDWGYVQWIPKLTSVLWDGMIQQSEYICKELLGDNYCRFNPLLETEIPLDDPLQIPVLVETAKKQDLTLLINFIRKQFYDDKDVFQGEVKQAGNNTPTLENGLK